MNTTSGSVPPSREEVLFAAALALPSAERPSYLERACGGDSALRARLEALLAAHDSPDQMLPPSPAVVAALSAGTIKLELPDDHDEALGTRISYYKLLQRLGEGGCGVVYMAEQEEPVRRRVALKVIKLGMDTRQVVARFEAERQALAMMDHPNIAKVLDAGTTGSGRPYFVMELVRGIRITDYCDQNHLTTEARLQLFMAICQAVQHAHQKGIIHRDLKPSNILVTMHDGVPVPKVIDFGIAKAIDQKLTTKTLFTELHQFIGTPAYMSPEQAEMSGLDIDTRSDIYSLGVLLYELLTGQTPFDARELVKEGLDAIRRAIREVEPPRPSTRLSTLANADLDTLAKARGTGSTGLRTALRGDLDWIVMKCLEKDRTRRYETANGLAMDLKRHLNDEPVVAGPPGTGYKLRKFARRNRVAIVVAGTISAVLVMATVVSAWQAVRARKAEEKAKERLAESEAVTTFLTTIFESPDPLRDGRKVTVVETLDRAATNLDRNFGSQPRLRANLQFTLAGTYGSLGLYDQAVLLQEKAAQYFVSTSGRGSREAIEALLHLAGWRVEAGQTQEALKLAGELVDLCREVYGPRELNTVKSMNILAVCLLRHGQNKEALKLGREVTALFTELRGPKNEDTLNAIHNLALYVAACGDQTEANRLREQVLQLRLEVNGPRHRDTLRAMHNLALAYYDENRADEAVKLQQDLLPLLQELRGPEHPETLDLRASLVRSYTLAGRKPEAIKVLEELLPLCRSDQRRQQPLSHFVISQLALAYSDERRWAEATELQRDLVKIINEKEGSDSIETHKARCDLAQYLFQAGQREEGLKRLKESEQHFRRNLGPTNETTLLAMNNLASMYYIVGSPQKALELLQELAKLYREIHDYTNVVQSLIGQADCHFRTGEKDKMLSSGIEALTQGQAHLGFNAPVTLVAMHALANAYGRLGRLSNAVPLFQETVSLSCSVNGPEHLDTVAVITDYISCLVQDDRPSEAFERQKDLLPILIRKVPPGHQLLANAAQNSIAICRKLGKTSELVPVLEQLSTRNPGDALGATTLAALQVWFGDEQSYFSTCGRMLAWATNSNEPFELERVAKLSSIRPLPNPDLQQLSHDLANRAVKLGQTNLFWPWFLMTEGMAEYRIRNYKSAEAGLTKAPAGAQGFDPENRARVEGISGFYRSMSLLHLSNAPEARSVFAETESKMKPLPPDEKNPLAGESNHDDLILWLAYKEAREFLGQSQPNKPDI